MSNNITTFIDQFFDDTFRPLSSSVTRALGSTPALNVTEYDNRYETTVTIPGIDPKKVKVQLNDKVLNISYDHQNSVEEEKEEGVLLRQEYSHYSFSRKVALPKNIDIESISAKTLKGILTVTVNKLPESQPKSVEIAHED
jgi:HSP20 family protein